MTTNSWKSKLTSRKFLVTIGTALTGLLSVFFDWDVDPNIIIGVCGVIATWVFTEGKLDGTAMAVDGQQKEQIISALQGKLSEYAGEINRLNEEKPAGQKPRPR